MTSFWIWSVIVLLMYMSRTSHRKGAWFQWGHLAAILWRLWLSCRQHKASEKEARVFNYVAQFKTDDLTTLAQLMASGAVKSVIDRTFPLEETAKAMAMQGSRRISGKVVIVIQDDEQKQQATK
jgi:NADPH:quinone reductase-like Zn-dependent oxidoreductase